MKVVLLAPTPPPQGGIAGWTKRMMHAELKDNWKVVVVDEKVTGNRDAYNSSKKNYFDEAKRCLRIWRDLNIALKDREVAVVQACIPAGTTSMLREIVSALICKCYKKKFIVHFRCTLPNMLNSRLAISIFKRLIKLSDSVFLLNTASSTFFKQYSLETPFYVIPNFIETNAIQQKRKINKELKNLTYVGGVIEEKGCDLIAEVAKHFPDKTFRLIGNVDMDVTAFPQNVILLGEQPKEFVQNELENSDAFIFLTRFRGEGFSNALAEAMSHSLPCIVSDWAANADMIENKGGVILESYSIDYAIDAVNKIESEDVRRKMGEWNYSKVLSQYSDSIITNMYVDAYKEIVGE